MLSGSCEDNGNSLRVHLQVLVVDPGQAMVMLGRDTETLEEQKAPEERLGQNVSYYEP